MSRDSAESVISALFIGKIADAAAAEGMDRAGLLDLCGVNAEQPIDPAQMVSADAHYTLWETILTALGSPGFPIRYAQTLCADDYGVFGLATKTAPTLRGSFQRAHRYLIVLTDSSWLEISESESSVIVFFRREGARRLGMRCANEAAVAEMVAHSREITGVDFKPRSVRFRHKSPDDVSAHAQFFGCDVLFEQESDGLELDRSVFDLNLPKADGGLSRFVLDHLDRAVAEKGTDRSLEHSLKDLICDAMPDGPPKMTDVARRVGMSRRTLARRLSALDTSFQRFVEDTRQEIATQLLRQTQHSLGEITFLLGFSEQSAFQRAFKRWTGSTPSAFRRRLM